MAETSEKVLRSGLPLAEVHLVDTWDTNDAVFQAASRAVHTEPGEAQCPTARAHVLDTCASLAPTHDFDPSGARHYAGPTLHRGDDWPSSLLLSHSVPTAGRARVAAHNVPSVEASRGLADGTPDLIFIDGAHDHASVSEDLRGWYPKVRDDGVVAGHDFSMAHPGVVSAVLDFVSRLPGPRVDVYLDSDHVFWFRKRSAG